MKQKLTAAALALTLLLLTGCGAAEAEPSAAQTLIAGLDARSEEPPAPRDGDGESARSVPDLSAGTLPAILPGPTHESSEFSRETALCLLGLCSGHTEERTRQLFEAAGFSVLLQKNFDKAADAPDHSCAFTVGLRRTAQGRTQYLVALRGTNGGEWYSNFDFAPSQSGDTAFAENFLFAAQDAFLTLSQLIDFTAMPQILVCGHSRGAACANLLGVLLDESYLPGNVYTYTFATPLTLRPARFDGEYDNIFNVINPGDLVPRLPLAGWGYARAGTDIVLRGEPAAADRAQRVEDTLLRLAPDIPSYYTVRHSLTEAGESAEGMTAFSLMEALSTVFSGAADLSGTAQTELPAADGDFLSELISDESDFAPLRELLCKAAADNGAIAAEVLQEHLPDTYARLLSEVE